MQPKPPMRLRGQLPKKKSNKNLPTKNSTGVGGGWSQNAALLVTLGKIVKINKTVTPSI